MAEKYDIDKMLEEIKEDEILEPVLKNVKISQKEILNIVKKRRKKEGDKA